MNIHEYQAKDLLSKHGVSVQTGIVAASAEEAVSACERLQGPLYIVKAQIHAGGRGAGRFANDLGGKGGVRLARSAQEVHTAASAMLGQTLITKQTGPLGRIVRHVYVAQGVDIAHEYYCAIVLDRSAARVAFVVSREGGMEIEEVARTNPAAIAHLAIDPVVGFQPFHGRILCKALGIKNTPFFARLYAAFVACDASILEINPMIITEGGEVMALDAKASLDDNALFRHPELAALRDEFEEEERECMAHEHDLSYVALDGEIGCMVNGAGLAMATMDIIKLHGGTPANFLDVGGNATAAKVAAAFKIILSDTNVKGILVNIFGGIMRCPIIASGIIAAAREVALSVPLVVRLEGTQVAEGKALLAASGLPIISADHLEDAAQKIVTATRGV